MRSDFPQMQLQCAPRRKLSLMVVLSRIIGKSMKKPKGSQNITSFQVKDTYFSQNPDENRIHFIKQSGNT